MPIIDQLVTPPSTEPLTLDDVHAHLRFEAGETEEDGYLTGLITAARTAIEAEIQYCFLTQTWEQNHDVKDQTFNIWLVKPFNPTAIGTISLNKRPLQAVNAIYERRLSGDTVVDPSIYGVNMRGGQVVLQPGSTWPQHDDSVGYTVNYTVGWTDVSLIPQALLLAMKLQIAYWWANRGLSAENAKVETSSGGGALAADVWGADSAVPVDEVLVGLGLRV